MGAERPALAGEPMGIYFQTTNIRRRLSADPVKDPRMQHRFRRPVPFFAAGLCLALGLAFPFRSQAQLSFNSDLESEQAQCWTLRPGAGCNGWMSIRDNAISLNSGGFAHSGKTAIKIVYTKNEDYAGTYRETDTRHIFTRFYDYYDSGFDFAAGMKIHRLSGYNAAKQLNDFDIILYSQAAGPSSNFCGTSDMQYMNLAYNGGPVDWGLVGGALRMERGRWYCIETEVKLNTPGKSDGELRIWVDGRLFAQKMGMNLTGSVASPINHVLFGGWYSNAAAGKNPCPNPVVPSIRYVDDVAISGSYIGTIPVVAAGPLPGTRVASWTQPAGGTSQIEYGLSGQYGKTTAIEAQAGGVYAMVIPGLDTNSTYHYRVKTTWSAGGQYVSPDFTFSTSLHPGPNPGKKPRPPKNLAGRDYDPIPD
jgi:hypothetical protein